MLYAGLLLGSQGAIPASAGLVPEFGAVLCRQVQQGDLTAPRATHRRLFDVVWACQRGAPPSGWKTVPELAGMYAAHLGAAPGSALSEVDRQPLGADLVRLVPHLVADDG
jgi:dihydrodipicolinate synthase/N-acetylneuraminate lyase